MLKNKLENDIDLYEEDLEPRNDIIREGRIGIMPIGALSIAFASYIGIDTFIESGRTHYGIGKKLKIHLGDKVKETTLTEENYTDNINTLLNGRLPEIILFSPPNHRLILVLDEIINMIGEILKLRHINYLENDIDTYIPKIVMLSNGIYYDEIMNYITKNFEFVDENIREKIKGNFIRGTTMQTGIRSEEEDKEPVFVPGTKSSITIAGGSKQSREKVIELFNKFGYPVLEMEGEEVRRIEFDKAIVNLSANAVQLSLLYDDEGKVHSYTLGDLVSNKNMQDMCKKIIYNMVSIGVKSGIYKDGKQPVKNRQYQKQLIDKISQEKWEKIEEKSKIDNVHIVSSIATIIERYRKGRAENKTVRIPPLEENIINYLLNLADENNLIEEKKIIEELRDSILRVCNNVWC